MLYNRRCDCEFVGLRWSGGNQVLEDCILCICNALARFYPYGKLTGMYISRMGIIVTEGRGGDEVGEIRMVNVQ